MTDTSFILGATIGVAIIFVAAFVLRLLHDGRKLRNRMSASWRREQAKRDDDETKEIPR